MQDCPQQNVWFLVICIEDTPVITNEDAIKDDESMLPIPASPCPSAPTSTSPPSVSQEKQSHYVKIKKARCRTDSDTWEYFFSGIFTLSVFGYCNLSDISSALVRVQGSDTGGEGGQYLYCNTKRQTTVEQTSQTAPLCQPNLPFS